MFMLNIMISVLGVIFFVLGFLVSFKKRYELVLFLIKGARKSADFAEQIGLILLMSGMLYIFVGIAGLVSSSLLLTVSLAVISLSLTASLMTLSTLKARRV